MNSCTTESSVTRELPMRIEPSSQSVNGAVCVVSSVGISSIIGQLCRSRASYMLSANCRYDSLTWLIDLPLFRWQRLKDSPRPFLNEMIGDGSSHPKLLLQLLARFGFGLRPLRLILPQALALLFNSLPYYLFPFRRISAVRPQHTLPVPDLFKHGVSSSPNESFRIFAKLIELDLSVVI